MPNRAARAHVRLAVVTAALALSLAGLPFSSPAAAAAGSGDPDLGPNVLVFDPGMPTSEIQARVDAITARQRLNQFGAERYALLFKPGTYGSAQTPLIIEVGYYTEVAGLGKSPTDVTINGHVDVYNQCDANGFCIALNNFWRSLSNLTINVTGLADCRAAGNFWAASCPTRSRARSSTARSSSTTCATAASGPGPTVSGTRCSPGCTARRRSASRRCPAGAGRTPPSRRHR
jgi:hypothetical protein